MKAATIVLFSELLLCEIVPRPAKSMIQNACIVKLRDKLKRRLQNIHVSESCKTSFRLEKRPYPNLSTRYMPGKTEKVLKQELMMG